MKKNNNNEENNDNNNRSYNLLIMYHGPGSVLSISFLLQKMKRDLELVR